MCAYFQGFKRVDDPGQRSGDDPNQLSGDDPNKRSGDDLDHRIDDDLRQRSGEDPSHRSDENPGLRIGDDPLRCSGDNSSYCSGGDPEQHSGDESRQRSGVFPEQYSGDDPDQRGNDGLGQNAQSSNDRTVELPGPLLRHAEYCDFTIYEVPRNDNSLCSALADQMNVQCRENFTGESLRDRINTSPCSNLAFAQQGSYSLPISKIGQGTQPSIQNAADCLGHRILLYRDDDNPPYLFKPKLTQPVRRIRELNIGCIEQKYFVSLRPRGKTWQDTGSDVDDDVAVSESLLNIQIGDNNTSIVNLPTAGGKYGVKNMYLIGFGDNNTAKLNINSPHDVDDKTASGSSVENCRILIKSEVTGMSQSDIEMAERNILEHKNEIQKDINDDVKQLGIKVVDVGKGCILVSCKAYSWLDCKMFIDGLSQYNERYLTIFRRLLNVKPIIDSNDIRIHATVSIEYVSKTNRNISDLLNEQFTLGQRDRQEKQVCYQKMPEHKIQPESDPADKGGTLYLHAVVKPNGNESSLTHIGYEYVAETMVQKVLDFKRKDVSYIPHWKSNRGNVHLESPYPTEYPGSRRSPLDEEVVYSRLGPAIFPDPSLDIVSQPSSRPPPIMWHCDVCNTDVLAKNKQIHLECELHKDMAQKSAIKVYSRLGPARFPDPSLDIVSQPSSRPPPIRWHCDVCNTDVLAKNKQIHLESELHKDMAQKSAIKGFPEGA